MSRKQAIKKGLTDAELVEKYEAGQVDLKKPLLRLIKGGKSPKIKKKKV